MANEFFERESHAFTCHDVIAGFPLGEFVRANRQKIGTLPTCSRRIFSRANFNQSRCRILVFASREQIRLVENGPSLDVQSSSPACRGFTFLQQVIVPDKTISNDFRLDL